MKLTIPGISLYQQFVAAARGLIKKEASTNAETGLGSTLYEWVVRPAAAVFGGLSTELNDTFTKYGLSYLSTSTATDNPIADQVMENYFITRKTGANATAVVTVLSSTGSEYIAQGVSLTVEGATLNVAYSYQAYTNIPDGEDSDTVRYVKSHRLPTGQYIYSIQCTSTENTDEVIPAGAEVTGLEYLNTVESAYLESALSGGSVIETDAEMVLRAKSSLASPVGSSGTIDKLIRSFGVPVLGTRSFGFGDPEMIRGTNNVLLTSIGGCVDTYVQTSNYLATKTLTIELTKVGNYYEAPLSTPFSTANWFYNVSSVEPMEGSLVSWTTEYYSLDSRYTAEAVRLSSLQGCRLKVLLTNTSAASLNASVAVQYMPSIGTIQDALNGSQDKPLGMSILIKAAPIALLGVSGKVTGVTTAAFAEIYKGFLKSRGVGSGVLRLSELSETLQSNVPDAKLISPTVFTLGYVTNTDEVLNSYVTDGVVRPHEHAEYGWTSRTFCYCTADNMIRVVGDD